MTAVIRSLDFNNFKRLWNREDGLINEYRDFATDGVPENPLNFNTYLAETSGSEFTIGRLYLFFSSIFYETSPPPGFFLNDGINLYQSLIDNTILTLPPDIYNDIVGPLDLNSTGITNVTSFSAPAGQNSIVTSPITYSSYASSNLTATINNFNVQNGSAVINGFSNTSLPLIGTVNNDLYTVGQNGLYAVHLSLTGFGAATLLLRLENITTGVILSTSSSLVVSSGAGVNYIGLLNAGDQIRGTVNSTLAGQSNVTLKISRIN